MYGRFCVNAGKKWLHCETEELAIAAFKADNSNWSQPSLEFLEFFDRQVGTEIDKTKRDKKKGYARG